MSDEKQPVDEKVDNQEKKVDNQESKSSNKSYSQSEFDSLMAKKESELKEKYADYDDLKSKYTEIEKWKKEKELAEMSEVEKQQKMVDDLKAQNEKFEKEKNEMALQILKNEVLSDKKYATLTRAYKQLVKGASKEELELSADQALKEYTDDLRLQGVKLKIPMPDLTKGDKVSETTPQTPAEKAKAVFERKAKEHLQQF
jgi:hypothetical protein